jgi:predicted ATPase
MLIQRLKADGLLSFGPQGLDLPLHPLNVLIGPNGSGKSNLLEILALFRAAPSRLATPFKEAGGIGEWLGKGLPAGDIEARIDAFVSFPAGDHPLWHTLFFGENGGRFEVFDEWIESWDEAAGKPVLPYFYRFRRGRPILNGLELRERHLQRENVSPEESILSQVRDPERYSALSWLQQQYEAIRLYRNWSFGPAMNLRRAQSTHARGDFLSEGGDNLALVLSKFRSQTKAELLESLQKLYEGIQDFHITVEGGNVLLFLEEAGGREIPATRLSDGTLRYLCLLAILLHPEPPPLLAIEEPELGLHPDVIPHIAELLVRASERTQIVATTHSRMLVDALSDHPASVVICEKVNGESQMTRLDATALRVWLENYSLGDLWSMGELGGNRW